MQASALSNAAPYAGLSSPKGSMSGRAGKYLVFRLGSEEFGAEVLKVSEIVELQAITHVPQMPGFVKGVINLRGRVIPVIDLRLKLGLPFEEYTRQTCMVVVRTVQEDESLTIGMIVDGVTEVLTLAEAEIEDAPEFGARAGTPYVKGLAKVRGRVKILLDVDRLLSMGEMTGRELVQ